MKKLFLILMFSSYPVFAQKITLDLDDKKVSIIEIYEGPISEVLQRFFDEKSKLLKDRLVSETVKNSIQKSEIIPAGEDAIVTKGIQDRNAFQVIISTPEVIISTK